MKILLINLLAFLLLVPVNGQKHNPEYDSLLAKRLGADDYGMKRYVLVILKTGTAVIEPGARRDSLFMGHMENINRLAEVGKLVVAGPLGDNSFAYRGIFILNVPTIAEAQKLIYTDPTVKEQIFDAELIEWYGSAALGEYLDTDRKAGKYKF